MTQLEEIGTDASEADGYVVLFRHGDTHTVVLAVPGSPPMRRCLRKFEKAVTSAKKLTDAMEAFKIEVRTVSTKRPRVYEISFAIRNGNDELIELFLQFMMQSRVIMNPIVSDIRHYKIK